MLSANLVSPDNDKDVTYVAILIERVVAQSDITERHNSVARHYTSRRSLQFSVSEFRTILHPGELVSAG
jgi:hypothetical protein